MAQVVPQPLPAALAADAAAAPQAILQQPITYSAKFANMGDLYEGAYLPFLGAFAPTAQNAPAAGIYPFRILYWQTGHGANLQFYTIDDSTMDRILVNDSVNDPRAIKAYRDSSNADANAPYVAEVSPSAGSAP